MTHWIEQLIAHEARYYAQMAALERTSHIWFFDSAELPDYHDANRALRLRADGRGPEAIAREIVAHYRARGLPPIADVDVVAEAQGIGAALRRRGVTPVVGDWLLMRYPHAHPPALPPSAVRVEIVPNTMETDVLRDWIETALSDTQGDEDAAMWRGVVEREARFPTCRCYLGWWDERPVGTCSLFSADGWGRVENVATRPEWRRRGVASAVVARAVADSLALGNTTTYLFSQAGGAGENLYARLGFVPWSLNPLRRHIGT